MSLIELKEIRKTYSLGELDVPVLKGISLTIDKGEYVALMGASGSGKSTLMNILGCLDRPTSGDYLLEDEEVGRASGDRRAMIRNRKIGFVFQSFNLLPRTTALENVIMPLSYTASDLSRRESRKRGIEMLERVGLSERIYHYPSQLSGGQQQRVALARTLAQNPKIILADEPVAALDPVTAKQVMSDFKKINQEMNITILINIHHVELALAYADRIIGIRAGKIVYDGPSADVTEDVLNMIYAGKIPDEVEEA